MDPFQVDRVAFVGGNDSKQDEVSIVDVSDQSALE